MSDHSSIREHDLGGLLPPRLTPRSDLLALLLLLTLSITVKAWLISRACTIATDGYRFIRTAQQLEAGAYWGVVRETHQHPVYPAWISLVSKVLQRSGWNSEPRCWQLSAQLASAICGVLLVLPMYGLGRRIFNRAVGFWGAALFCVLPVPARVAADGLSDFTFLFFVFLSFWLMLRALEQRSLWWLIGACGSAGLGYLTRPEGLVALLSLLVLFGSAQAWPHLRWPRGRLIAAAGAIVMVLVGLLVPYMVLVGGVSLKPSIHMVLGLGQPSAQPLHEALLAVGDEFLRCNSYVFVLFAALAWLHTRSYTRRTTAAWLVVLLFFGTLVATIHLSWKVGYLSQRHMLPAVAICCYWAAAGLIGLPQYLTRAVQRWARPSIAGQVGSLMCSRWSALVPLLLAGLWCLPSLAQPLHYNRAAHLEVAEWLSRNTAPTDMVVDLCGIAGFHANRPTYSLAQSRLIARQGHVLRRLVVEANDRGRSPFRDSVYLEALLQHATPVAYFPNQPRPHVNRVVVYELAQEATQVARRWGRRARARRRLEQLSSPASTPRR